MERGIASILQTPWCSANWIFLLQHILISPISAYRSARDEEKTCTRGLFHIFLHMFVYMDQFDMLYHSSVNTLLGNHLVSTIEYLSSNFRRYTALTICDIVFSKARKLISKLLKILKSLSFCCQFFLCKINFQTVPAWQGKFVHLAKNWFFTRAWRLIGSNTIFFVKCQRKSLKITYYW